MYCGIGFIKVVTNEFNICHARKYIIIHHRGKGFHINDEIKWRAELMEDILNAIQICKQSDLEISFVNLKFYRFNRNGFDKDNLHFIDVFKCGVI